MPDVTQYFPISNPTLIFFVVLCIILFAPIIMGKLRIPHIVGMVLAGVLVGEYGLDILKRDDSFELFGKVGMYYIMFLAGLEMDMESMRKSKNQFIVFGLLTAGIPFVITYVIALWLMGYSHPASFLLGCIMASNTLVAYPIVGRYGLQQHPASALSVGSTMIALFISLTAIAALAGTFSEGSEMTFWLLFIVKIAGFSFILIMLIPRAARWFLHRYSDAVMQFIFVLAVMFFSAAMAEVANLEGILGAFLSGLILNRYIPTLSPLMNRIEFIGNALFIPYFLIGVGMLINVHVLFQGGNIVWVVLFMVFVGTFGKALAAYLACLHFRMPLSSGHLLCGLTTAHAAGAIAMVMVGMRLETAPGVFLVNDEILNGVVIMILFTCIISSIITERAAKRIVLSDNARPAISKSQDDEKILLPVKYPELAEGLLNVAVMMRNAKLNRGLVALNIVYDDHNRQENQERGRQLLEKLEKIASAYDVRMQTQVRIAANIANGIKHAFKEFDASEIIMGLHIHKEISPKFWGEFAQSLYNGLNRQIIFVRLKQPLNTLRCIKVAVPSRAEFEPGFIRWLERLLRLAGNLDCRILFYARHDCNQLIGDYVRALHPNVRSEFETMEHWNELPHLASRMNDDHLMVFVTSRKGNISYKTAFEKLPKEIEQFYAGKSLMIVFPDQHGDRMDAMTFAEPQHQEEKSAYQGLVEWFKRKR
ncbi:MAG: cation:proton antiporter [Prevotella sp.]|nr:cation:proton antiporter [Prevotella sp.]